MKTRILPSGGGIPDTTPRVSRDWDLMINFRGLMKAKVDTINLSAVEVICRKLHSLSKCFAEVHFESGWMSPPRRVMDIGIFVSVMACDMVRIFTGGHW